MTAHTAARYTAHCRCGALTAVATGAPVRISVCHCLDCQRRAGSAFAAQVRFPVGQVRITGPASTYETIGGSGRTTRFRFCPTCGDQIAFANDGAPETVAIPLGAFAQPHRFAPAHSIWEERKHAWVTITGPVDHLA